MEGFNESPRKLKKALTPRNTPEGNSTRKKSKAKLLQSAKSPATKLLTNTKKSDQSKTPSDKEKKRKLSENSPGVLNTSDLYENIEKKNDSVKKKKKKLENSFEEAVEKARGVPDGESLHDSTESKKKQKPAMSQKGGKFEKSGKRKTLGNIKNAAKNFKKFGGKEENRKAVKRKSGEDGGKGENKKVKLEEMSVKDRRKQRKMLKNNYELSLSLKREWEAIRRHKMDKAKKEALCDKVFSQITGKAKELIKAHDTARVIQSLIKYGTPAQRESIFQELKDCVLEMSKSKYSKFIVMKILKYGNSAQRQNVFTSFHGSVRKLVRHEHASDVLEFAYNNFANAAQRSAMVEEFYGPSFALFKTGEIRTLDQIMKSHPDKRDSIISNLKSALSILAEKNVIRHSLVHRLYLEYFTYAPPAPRSEMIETVRENLIHMLHTRDGSRVAMYCLWYGTAKDRKVIVKSMKTYVEKVCKEEYGHMVLLAMFDVVDDTKLVHKAILDEMLKSVKELAFDQYGKKVLLYLLSPRASQHFHPDIVNILQQGDDNPNSKKDTAVRRRELLEAVSRPLLQFIIDNTSEVLTDNSALLLLLEILSKSVGDPSEAMTAVARVTAEPYKAGTDQQHVIEQAAGHMTIKRLIMNDSERIKQGSEVLFSKQLMETLPEGSLRSWAACNRGCFIICSLLDLNVDEVREWVKKEISPIKDSLKKMTFKGAQILLGKLN